MPKMFKVRQIFPRPVIQPEDIPMVVKREISQEKFSQQIRPGMNIAITAGSRGIANVAIITKAIVDFVVSKGANPFVVPAMGSHGGATAEGQLEVLAGYGITEEYLGYPIKSSMEVKVIGLTDLFAVPCIENAFDETCKIVGVNRDEILEEEPKLLQYAFSNMPKIIVGECDVLIVDEVGKNYGGTGVDPNITGTFSTKYASGGVKVQRTAMLDLSEPSHGNGLGTGLASVITKRLFDKLDLEKMYPNCITSTVLESARIPCIVASDKEAIQLCIRTCVDIDKEKIRIVRIPNSLHIEHIMLSESYYDEIKNYPDLEIEGEPEYLQFNSEGNLW